MIPVSLVIKGLYSYQEPQKIEFDTLIGGQLFGIFGSVGSGKSSILEAISFALYGETERLNQRDSRNYNMMNLRSDELLIDFQFRNYDETVYRFTVRGKRNSKDFLKVNTFDRTAYRWNNNDWEPLESASADLILGLSYKNFRRTIIIPQGKFQEFLQLGDSDRTKMLKEIFHLDKFEFSQQTLSLEKKNNEALQNLNGQLSHYSLVNQEVITLKENEVKELTEACSLHKIQILKKDLIYKEQQNLKRLYDERTGFKEQLDVLNTKGEEIKHLEKKVRDYEYGVFHFKDLLKRRQEIEQTIQSKTAEFESHSKAYDTNAANLELLEKEGVKVKSDFQKQDKYKDLVADYQLVLSIVGLKEERAKLQKRIEEGQMHVDQTAGDRAVAQEQLNLLKQKRVELRSNIPDMGKLANLRNWFDKKDQYTAAIQKQNSKLEKLNIHLLKINNEIREQLKGPLLVEVGEGSFPDYHGPSVNELRKQLQLNHDEIQDQINHLHLQKKLGEFSTKLNHGEACMLCGSIHHPSVLKVEDVESRLLQFYHQLEGIKGKGTALESISSDLSKLIVQEQSFRAQVEEIQSELNNIIEQDAQHDTSFVWSDFSADKPQQVREAFQFAEKNRQQLDVIENEIQVLENTVSQKIGDYERFGIAVNNLKLQLKGKESECNALEKRLQSLTLVEFNSFTREDLQDKIHDLNIKIESEKKRYDDWTEKSTVLNDLKIALKERVEFAKQSIIDCRDQWKQNELELKEKFIASPFISFEEIQNTLLNSFSNPDQLENTKKAISDYYQQSYSLSKQIERLGNLIGHQIFDNIAFIELEIALNQLKENYEAVNSAFIQGQSDLNKIKADFDRKKLLEKEQENLQHRAANLYTLKQLFKSDGFVSYISTVYLQNLCEVANKRFYRLTRQQLRLEVTDKNEFQVRDYLNNGRVRNVKTLSGGQTFQASLSLALALAESVQQQNKSNQNFFFLDEGFGSLDKESLQIAFDTLKSLRQENRIVGVISHVEELQQEIDVFLNVVNDPFTGSKIMGNWQIT